MREVRPTVVFAMSPGDYMIDHEVSSAMARNAAFVAGVPNIKTEPLKPFRPVPYVYYADPVEGKDIFGRPVQPAVRRRYQLRDRHQVGNAQLPCQPTRLAHEATRG